VGALDVRLDQATLDEIQQIMSGAAGQVKATPYGVLSWASAGCQTNRLSQGASPELSGRRRRGSGVVCNLVESAQDAQSGDLSVRII
jgi:hypothetical protein